MKFNEMTYTRPDIDALLTRCKELAAKAAAAASDEEIVDVYYEQSHAFADYNTSSMKTARPFPTQAPRSAAPFSRIRMLMP